MILVFICSNNQLSSQYLFCRFVDIELVTWFYLLSPLSFLFSLLIRFSCKKLFYCCFLIVLKTVQVTLWLFFHYISDRLYFSCIVVFVYKISFIGYYEYSYDFLDLLNFLTEPLTSQIYLNLSKYFRLCLLAPSLLFKSLLKSGVYTY